MGWQERLSNTFVLMRQRIQPEAFLDNEGRPVPINWVNLNGSLAAFFPEERTDFTQRIEGVNTRSLANAYILGFIREGID